MEMKRMIFGLLLPAALLLAAGTGCSAKVKEYRAEAVAEYLHDTGAYTQGLFFSGGRLYESTGQFGESSLRIVDLESGRVERQLDFNSKYFVEGSVAMGDSLYILTWTNRVAFIYNLSTFEYVSTLSYPRQGWGLTTDGISLIASDGSSRLYFMDRNLKVGRTVNVRLHGKPLNYLNELEYIGGKIWANVYMTNMIVIIDPESGNVESVIDCTGLLPDRLRTEDTDVLNGIAYDGSSGKIYLTGKNWPLLFEIRLEEKK